ncbi:hypothetical protein PP7435_CHR1-1290 [Komagataella phaffii CBS 7435]|uniref:Altered inheritance of mitochondria protein 9, mitochondrial n=2 Tax=Komagataella phaffii TaxID=460519 RepID=AIM9_KOMPG|nr:uncharacterized protein PAS_chr1-4_0684 [Komagataella phaffii GS115]C4QYL7.1 RecName: Full=Altered inheritance of mitochondria protein 9, mitochondrial; AltName: Full=Found in mitochondrial proteome protein 29; Flags: Precursor [Komagataella phaffii GS115]AOA61548.1 GQ67_01663T0 [Komagataella phaffii]CAH2447165.1 hypothetical protein BQ9382_C1-6740 [Komagataella phaffii CBS 7435]AOA66027.1 GQ68_01678T0 [Komagataella phaffii GS115]CAY68341.1 hypothetical protein PAS_chr1-4_0684 [Komagataella
MLKLATKLAPCSRVVYAISKPSILVSANQRRFNSSTPNDTVYTSLNDENDPQRDAFFQYTWGTWLKDDKEQKQKRVTRFSIEGVNSLLAKMYDTSRETMKSSNVLTAPVWDKELKATLLPSNLDLDTMGVLNPNEKIVVTQMASIHEGKHHRVYKLDTNTQKSFVLRLPYNLDGDFYNDVRVKSEAATLDFLRLKLGMKVPKVFAYGADAQNNALRSVFTLMEFIEGDLLMKRWNPLVKDSEGSQEQLKSVLDPLADIQRRLLEVTFTKFGSLYFAHDVEESLRKDLPYKGEVDTMLVNRWKIGPSAERVFYRDGLPAEEVTKFTGPWKNAIDEVVAVADSALNSVELSLQKDLTQEQETILNRAKEVYQDFRSVAPVLFESDLTKSSLPNGTELFLPRLHVPELDPLNVVDNTAGPYLLDVEGANIKPFILHGYPVFLSYDGPKIYNVNEDVEGYSEMSPEEQRSYDVMYMRTRNQFIWEFALNARCRELVGAVAPAVKMIREPYLAAVRRGADVHHYLNVESSLLALSQMWDSYRAGHLVGAEKFPVKWAETEEAFNQKVQRHREDLIAYQTKIASAPFSATNGWVPQDMFNTLKEQGIIVQDGEDYVIKDE